jgi:hypothetical protein
MAPIVAYASVVSVLLVPLHASASSVTRVAYEELGNGEARVCLRPDGGVTQTPFIGWGDRCPGRSTPVVVDICRPHESPAPNFGDANRARAAAYANGSIRNATYRGRRFCVRHIDHPFSPSDPMESDSPLPSPPPCCGS